MAEILLDVPDDLLAELTREARRVDLPRSEYVVHVLQHRHERTPFPENDRQVDSRIFACETCGNEWLVKGESRQKLCPNCGTVVESPE